MIVSLNSVSTQNHLAISDCLKNLTNALEHKLAANTKKYLEMRQDANAKNAVFYLGDISMNINGTSYVSWKDWGDL